MHGNTTADDQRNAAEAVFSFMAPSSDKTVGSMPSEREHGRIMGVPRTTLQCFHKKA